MTLGRFCVLLMSQCLFCPTTKLTKEHVWPDWLVENYKQKVPPRRGLYRGTITIQQKVTRSFIQGTITERRSLVCDRCNSNWMSAIENFAKDRLWPLIEFGNSKQIKLSVEAQCAIAVWVQLRSFVFDALYEPPAEPHYSFDERLAFANDPHQFAPLPNTYIWLCPFVGKQWSVDRRVLNGYPIKGDIDARIHIASGLANRLAFQLFTAKGTTVCTPNFDMLGKLGWTDTTVQIWPCVGDAQWPPSVYIDDESLKVFQTRLSPDVISARQTLSQAAPPSPEKG